MGSGYALAALGKVLVPDAMLLLRVMDLGYSTTQVVLDYALFNIVYTLGSYPAGYSPTVGHGRTCKRPACSRSRSGTWAWSLGPGRGAVPLILSGVAASSRPCG